MPSLLEHLNADLKDAMRAGDTLRRDEIRGVIAMLRAEQQAKLKRTLEAQGLIRRTPGRGRRTEARMAILDEITDGPGFCFEELAPAELEFVRGLITAQYLDRLGRLQPELVPRPRMT